jgi:hypothetical protein
MLLCKFPKITSGTDTFSLLHSHHFFFISYSIWKLFILIFTFSLSVFSFTTPARTKKKTSTENISYQAEKCLAANDDV